MTLCTCHVVRSAVRTGIIFTKFELGQPISYTILLLMLFVML